MTDYHVIVYNIEQKKKDEWVHYSLGTLMELRIEDSAKRHLTILRNKFPDEEFRINKKTVTYTVTHEVLEEMAA